MRFFDNTTGRFHDTVIDALYSRSLVYFGWRPKLRNAAEALLLSPNLNAQRAIYVFVGTKPARARPEFVIHLWKQSAVQP